MDDAYFMGLALELAKERKGLTHPNPTVGCVIVKNGQIVAKANHEKAGMPHAEAKALAMAENKAKDSTLYVTLEPCAHYGRTPPCTEAIIKAGVKRVVIATLDPNPLVSGKGVERLKQAGIEVKVGVLEEQAKRLNEDFFTYITQRRPYITLKFAQSLDGSLATKDYQSKWISSEESRNYAHRLRAEASAVLVGINTVLRDNPKLTVRAFKWEKNPVRIVLDPKLKIPMDCHLIKDKEAKTMVITAVDNKEKIQALEEEGVEVLLANYENGLLNLREVLRELYFKEIMHLLVEGGAKTITSFLKEELFDRLCVFVAPMILGEGVRIGDLGIRKVEDGIKLRLRELKTFQQDLFLELVRE
ncbi:bifunctional diaminohydroxyphosphoribosylaminopyrimidine deaminase/5-amino-6-(5-phosphoribosylamino)uracil reductase RibD [Thermocrinis sp.]